MRRTLAPTATLILLLALAACSSTTQPASPPETLEMSATPTVEAAPTEPSEAPETVEPTEPERTDVDWAKFPSKYQQIIDEDTAAQNCDGLQSTFDAAPSDAKLLTYIDEALKIADCY